MALTLSALRSAPTYWVCADPDNGPCAYCSPADAMDGGYWTCSHMRCLIVDETPVVGKWHDSRVCPGNCSAHPLVSPQGSEQRLYYDAMVTGFSWGDVLTLLEDAALEAESPAQRAARLARKAAEEEEYRRTSEAKMVEYHVEKCASVYCDRSGGLKKTVLRMCKWDDHPAENGFPAGCAAHKKGACPWVHKDQPALMAELAAGVSARTAHTGGRDFSALAGRPYSAGGGRPPTHPSSGSGSGGGRVVYMSNRPGSGSGPRGGGGSRAAGSGGDGSAW